jgi:hypothetical protein
MFCAMFFVRFDLFVTFVFVISIADGGGPGCAAVRRLALCGAEAFEQADSAGERARGG